MGLRFEMERYVHSSGAVDNATIGAGPAQRHADPSEVPRSAYRAAPPKGQQTLDGNYQCVRLEFQGQSSPCQSPPLVLNQDGSYDIWGEHGTYEVVQGRWLVLSHSKRRGLGHFVSAHEIVFEYRVGSRVCRVTFRRVFDAPPGYRWG
jgi:hypothetical protein